MRATVIWLGIALAAAVVCLWTSQEFGALQPIRLQHELFLIGPFSPDSSFAVALIVGMVAITGALIASSRLARSGWRRVVLGTAAWLSVPVGAFIAFVVVFFLVWPGHRYTEISASVAGRDLVVREYGLLFAGGARVYERDGALLHWVATLPPAGDTAQPFGRGDFEVIRSGDHVVLRWKTEDPPGTDWARLP